MPTNSTALSAALRAKFGGGRAGFRKIMNILGIDAGVALPATGGGEESQARELYGEIERLIAELCLSNGVTDQAAEEIRGVLEKYAPAPRRERQDMSEFTSDRDGVAERVDHSAHITGAHTPRNDGDDSDVEEFLESRGLEPGEIEEAMDRLRSRRAGRDRRQARAMDAGASYEARFPSHIIAGPPGASDHSRMALDRRPQEASADADYLRRFGGQHIGIGHIESFSR